MKSVAILGAGISGLSTAYYLSKEPEIRITVFDQNQKPGGVIKTEKTDGFIIEAGPDSFLSQKLAAFDLCSEIGLSDQLIGSLDSQRKTYIWHEGRLKLLPEGMFLMVPASPVSFLRSDLISWYGKLSAIKDLFAIPERYDCSVEDWTEKRFGTEILHQIAEPLLSGIYGCDTSNLSLQSGLPQIWALQEKGSLIREMAKQRKNSISPNPLFTTFRDGMQTLTDGLYNVLAGHEFKLGSVVKKIEKRDTKWWIQDKSFDAAVLASSSVPEIISPFGDEISSELNSIRKNSAIIIVLAFKNVYHEGFGWLVPVADRQFALACTYISNKFVNRSPANHFLLRIFIGGRQARNWIHAADDQLIEMGLKDLHRITGISQEPILSRVYRWVESMPEYAVGHQKKISELNRFAQMENSLFLASNIHRGVGIPDCIAHAKETASSVSLRLSDHIV